MRAIAGAQRRQGQAVFPIGAGLQLAGAAITRGAVLIVGQVYRVARRIGGDAPAQFGQRHIVAIVHLQQQWAIRRAMLGGVADAQFQARQLLGFAVVQPDHPHRHQAQADSGGHGHRQGLGGVADQQDQPGDNQQNADEHEVNLGGNSAAILPKRRWGWRWMMAAMTLSTGLVLIGSVGTTEGLLKRVYGGNGHHVVHSSAFRSKWQARFNVLYPFHACPCRDRKMLRLSGIQNPSRGKLVEEPCAWFRRRRVAGKGDGLPAMATHRVYDFQALAKVMGANYGRITAADFANCKC
ncbi:hypothetical protein EMIT051CA3_10284 [Pseudomonas chlororaphis]